MAIIQEGSILKNIQWDRDGLICDAVITDVDTDGDKVVSVTVKQIIPDMCSDPTITPETIIFGKDDFDEFLMWLT